MAHTLRGRRSLPGVAQPSHERIQALPAAAQLRVEIGIKRQILRRLVGESRAEHERIALDGHARYREACPCGSGSEAPGDSRIRIAELVAPDCASLEAPRAG